MPSRLHSSHQITVSSPKQLYQTYAVVHQKPQGPGDARPTALQVVKDSNMLGGLKGKTILIFGTSSGIGVETARAICEAGATLLLTARDLPKLERVIEDIISHAEFNKSGPRPVAIELHLDELASVRKAAEEVKVKCGGELNAIINNAGVMAAPFAKTKLRISAIFDRLCGHEIDTGVAQDGFELQIGTNHLARFLLFQLLKPLLLKSAAESGTSSRVISVSSTGHRMSTVRLNDLTYSAHPEEYNEWAAYGPSKTANIWFTNYINRHYSNNQNGKLLGLAVHPGGIQTELYRHLTPRTMEGIDMDAFTNLFKSLAQGAATTVLGGGGWVF